MHLQSLTIYPIKSLDPLPLQRARVAPGGALENDREFAFRDEKGVLVRGKREPRLILVRSSYDLSARTLKLCVQGTQTPEIFHLDAERSRIDEWMSTFLGYRVTLQQDLSRGHPDDKTLFGPSLLAAASIIEVGRWFPGLPEAEVRRRFRMNAEVGSAPAFWEDRLYAEGGIPKRFCIGDVTLEGVNPIDRCIIVTRNPDTGESYPDFQSRFTSCRADTLPAIAIRSRFSHFFMLGLRTRVPATEVGKVIHCGDPIKMC